MIIQADAEISENYVQEAAIPGADPDFKNIQKRYLLCTGMHTVLIIKACVHC